MISALVAAVFWTVAAASSAIAQSPEPAVTAASPKPGPPATYYAAWGLIAISVLTVVAVLAAYLYHAPGFRQRTGRAS